MSERIYGGVIFIYWLGVKKGHQGKGVGKVLIDRFSRWAKKQGTHALHLYSAKEASRFYEKLGFRRVGLIEKGYFGANDYFMIKILQEPKEENFLK